MQLAPAQSSNNIWWCRPAPCCTGGSHLGGDMRLAGAEGSHALPQPLPGCVLGRVEGDDLQGSITSLLRARSSDAEA